MPSLLLLALALSTATHTLPAQHRQAPTTTVRHGGATIAKTVSTTMLRWRSPGPAGRTLVYFHVYVGGQELPMTFESQTSAYWSGRSTFVQLKCLRRDLAWTAIRTTPHPAKLRIVYRW